jgi:serine protease
MKRFLLLVPWVAAGTFILALTTAGSATAGTARGTDAHLTSVHVINLHKAYEARLVPSVQGQIAGIVYPNIKTKKPLHGRGGNGCAEPYCTVDYNGGPVQHSPHVYLLLWGPNWSSDPNQAATASYLENFYSGLGVQPQDNWSTVTSQYGDSSGFPTFNGVSVFKGAFQDTTTPPTGVDQAGLAAEADAFASAQGITDLIDAQIVVATQSGTCPSGFYAPSCNGGTGTNCAWHSFSNEPYTNLPYLLDAGTACGEGFVNSGGTHDGFSIVGGNEYAETITDPDLTGWYDPNDLAYADIAGKCTWDSHSHNVLLTTGEFAMQPLWSNNADECVMLIGGGTDQVVVANPGNQSTYQNSALSLYISGTSSGQHPLTWTATGLPAGLSIGPSGTGPGLISGKITAAPGTYNVSVQASDSTGAFGWYPFTWTVTADVGTAVTNQASGTCLNDRGYSITPGSQIQMWKCIRGPAEMFSHPTNAGELIVLGQCVTDPPTGSFHGGAGTLQVIEPCTPGAANQQWFHNSKNEYVLGTNFLCLTDQGGSSVNGVPAVIEKCTGATDQQWSGPS